MKCWYCGAAAMNCPISNLHFWRQSKNCCSDTLVRGEIALVRFCMGFFLTREFPKYFNPSLRENHKPGLEGLRGTGTPLFFNSRMKPVQNRGVLLSLDKFMIDFTVILKDYDDNNNNGGGVVEFIC